MLGACSLAPEPVAPVLLPTADGPVWPSGPDIPRYAYSGMLLGERDFRPPDESGGSRVKSALSWLIGLSAENERLIELQRPMAGTTDHDGRIYVTDISHHAVLIFDVVGKRLLKWDQAAPGEAFKAPIGIAYDGADGVFVADSELGEVFHIARDGSLLNRFGKTGLVRPTGIARDPISGRLFVADTGDHSVKVFDATGQQILRFGSRGTQPGHLNYPTQVAFDGTFIYVCDTLNFRIQKFTADGAFQGVFGSTGLYVGNMVRPKGVAVGPDGRIYITESYYDHLLVFDSDSQFLMAIGGTGRQIGNFYLPNGVWTDGEGRIYVADTFNGRIVVFMELTPVSPT